MRQSRWVVLQEPFLKGGPGSCLGTFLPFSLLPLCFLELDVVAEALKTFLYHEVNLRMEGRHEGRMVVWKGKKKPNPQCQLLY